MSIISTSIDDYYIYIQWWLLYLHPMMSIISTSIDDYYIYIRWWLLYLHLMMSIISTSTDDYFIYIHWWTFNVVCYSYSHWWLLYLHSLMTIISTTSVRRRHHPGIVVTVDFTALHYPALHYPAHMQFSITLPRRPITRITLRRMQGLFVLFWFWLHRGVFVCVLGWGYGGSDPVW